MKNKMRKLKNMTQKQKITAAVAVTLGVLIVITAVVLITKKPKINNEPSETVVFVDPKFGSLPVLEYGDDISSRIFQIDIDGEKIVISADKLVPEIDTMNVGKTVHVLKLENDEEVKISVEVKDTQYPEIIGEDSYEYEIPASVDYYDEDIGLEDFLRDNMKAKDPIDGELELAFEVPEIFGPEDYDVLVSAEDVNGNKTTKVVLVTLTLGEEEETEPTEPEEIETEPTEPTEPEETETEPIDWNPSDETTTQPTTTMQNTTTKPTTTRPTTTKPTDNIITKTEKVTKTVPFMTIYKDDTTIKQGEQRVSQEGFDGKVTITYRVTYTNGKETNRVVVSEEVIKVGKDKIVLVGTKETPTTTFPAFIVPSSLPPGAALIHNWPGKPGGTGGDAEHTFSYAKTLPNGGTIDTVHVLENWKVAVSGKDNSNISYSASRKIDSSTISYMWSLPDLEYEDQDVIASVMDAFEAAYGY